LCFGCAFCDRLTDVKQSIYIVPPLSPIVMGSLELSFYYFYFISWYIYSVNICNGYFSRYQYDRFDVIDMTLRSSIKGDLRSVTTVYSTVACFTTALLPLINFVDVSW